MHGKPYSFSRKYNLYKISCLIIGASIVGSMNQIWDS